ncbi:MAG TPA: hypothetical protein ENK55_10320 [Actinobacteria bacterium]|nr:hypothetical protein [Actinomycetota bacterium]
MGQPIEIAGVTPIGDVVVVETDRSFTGMLGEGFDRETVERRDDFAARLAAELFAADEDIDHVYVAMNDVVVRRPGGWSDEALDAVRRVVADFFRFYDSAASSS